MIRKEVTVEVDSDLLKYFIDKGTRSEVIMVLRRPNGNILISTKSFYPNGVFRLPSGSMHPNESPEDAFTREVYEETGLTAFDISKIAEIIHHLACNHNSIDITSHIFIASVTNDTPHPTDETEMISEYKEAGHEELLKIANQLNNLSGKWLGWGNFRAIAHQLVANYLVNSPT